MKKLIEKKAMLEIILTIKFYFTCSLTNFIWLCMYVYLNDELLSEMSRIIAIFSCKAIFDSTNF